MTHPDLPPAYGLPSGDFLNPLTIAHTTKMTRTKYREDRHPALVRQLIAEGCVDDRKIARAVGVAKSTLWRWTTKHADFAAAMAGVEKSLPKREIKRAKFEARARAVIAALREGHEALKNMRANGGGPSAR